MHLFYISLQLSFTTFISVFVSLLFFLSYSFSICYKFVAFLFMLFPRNTRYLDSYSIKIDFPLSKRKVYLFKYIIALVLLIIVTYYFQPCSLSFYKFISPYFKIMSKFSFNRIFIPFKFHF